MHPSGCMPALAEPRRRWLLTVVVLSPVPTRPVGLAPVMALDFCLIRSGRCAAEDGSHPGSGPWAAGDSRTSRKPSSPSWSPTKSRDPLIEALGGA